MKDYSSLTTSFRLLVILLSDEPGVPEIDLGSLFEVLELAYSSGPSHWHSTIICRGQADSRPLDSEWGILYPLLHYTMALLSTLLFR